VSRFLVSIEATGLPLTLALNKADLVSEEEVAARIAQCAEWGYSAVAISSANGRGLAELGGVLAGKTSVVAGPSGAGKSSLINALRLGRHRAQDEEEEAPVFGGGRHGSWEEEEDADDVQWMTGSTGEEAGEEAGESPAACSSSDEKQRALSGAAASSSSSGASTPGAAAADEFLVVGDMSKIGRGKHTTRVVRLISLPGAGLMADTPGFGLPTLDGVSSTGLGDLFPEFKAARREASGCRFVDCMHVAEPGCAVSSAGFERYVHYLKFLAEVKVSECGGGVSEGVGGMIIARAARSN